MQYQGEVKEGRKLVRLLGACTSLGSAADMTSHWLGVLDGGNGDYQAEYDPASHAFVYFAFNAYA